LPDHRCKEGFALRLSILDQSLAVSDRPHGQSIRDTIALAQYCEALGYERFWVSEHHNHGTIAGTAPEILMAAIAATTQRIRIGSAGVMLPHYAPLKVAEQFRVLDSIAPGRIELLALARVDGIGLVGQSGLFEEEGHLGGVGRAVEIELQHGYAFAFEQ